MKKIISLLVVTLVFVVGCSNDRKTPVQLGNEQQILHVGNAAEIADVDPHITTGMPEYRVQIAIFEGLVAKDQRTLEVIPGVAERWEISDDATVYTFHLRQNAKWSNGDELTAEDFVWSWKRALMPGLGNQYAYSLFTVKNAEAFHKSEVEDFSQVGVQALDKHTLRVELTSVTPYFLQLLDHHSMYPVHRATIEKFGAIDERGTHWSRPENFVGNGPFTLKTWVPNQVLTVAKSPTYWDADAVRLQEIHFYPIEQPTTEERMFRAGQLHITKEVPIEKRELYHQKHPDLLRSAPYYATYFYRFNTTIVPLNDVRVRQALAYSIDRKQITEKVTKGGQQPAYNLTPSSPAYTPTAKLPYDPEKARGLLAEAGFPNGEGFPTLTILYNTFEDHKKIALVIQEMWKRELNVDITLENQDWKVFLTNQRTMNYEISRASWVGDYYDPNTFLDMFVTNGGNNETGWSNKRYDELIRLASNTTDPADRYRYFNEAEAILVEELPILPVYTYAINELVSPSVKQWYSNVMDFWSYKHVYLDPQAGQ